MALTPSQLDKLPEPMIQLMSELQDEIISDICRRLAKADYLTPTAEWQLIKANQLTLSSQEVKRRIASKLKKSEKEVKKLYTEAVRTAIAEDSKIYKMAMAEGILSDNYREKLTNYTRSVAFSNTLKRGLKNTNGLMRNLTNSAAAAANRQLSDALDLAYLKVTSGAFTPQQAVYDAVKKLGADGIKCVNYDSGRTDQLDVAVRRAIVTGIGKTCCDMQLDLAKEMDCHLVEVSSHLGARPSHAEWQGQIYSLVKGDPKYPYFYDATGYGTGDGLGGWNCRHTFFPYFEGLSTPANAPTFTLEENAKVYKDTQTQRRYERKIRKSKRELAALDGARSAETDPAAKAKYDKAFARKSVTLKNQEARLNEHLKNTGLMPDNSRVRVDGFNRSVSQKVTWTAKKAAAEKETASIHERGGGNSQYTANRKAIDSKEYLQKFRGVTPYKSGSRRVGEACRSVIKDNDGKSTETIHILYSRNGRTAFDPIHLGELGGSFKPPWKDNREQRRKKNKGKHNAYILVHNHPNSTTFSFDDFVTLNDNPEIKTMIAAGHDGKVYFLTVGEGKRLDLSNENERNLARKAWNRLYRDLNGDEGALKTFCDEYGWKVYEK